MRVIPRRNVTAFPTIVRSLLAKRIAPDAVPRLEDAFRHITGCSEAIATSSGRHGLELLLDAIGDRVPPVAYVPALTIEAVPKLFRKAGYEVRFLDIDPETLSLTPEKIVEAHKGPGLLLVTHYFGLRADWARIREMAGSLDLPVIEDCAHTVETGAQGPGLGAMGLGGFFSFQTRKPLNGLGGGMVVTNDPEVGARVRAGAAGNRQSPLQDARKILMTSAEWLSLQSPLVEAVVPMLHRQESRSVLVNLYRSSHARSRSSSYSFSPLQASAVLGQLDHLEENIRRKRLLAGLYDRLLPDSICRPGDFPPHRTHGYYMYVVQHPRGGSLGKFLREGGIDCGIGSEVLPNCAPGRDCPGSEQVVREAVELPMYCELTESGIHRICDRVAEWIGSY